MRAGANFSNSLASQQFRSSVRQLRLLNIEQVRSYGAFVPNIHLAKLWLLCLQLACILFWQPIISNLWTTGLPLPRNFRLSLRISIRIRIASSSIMFDTFAICLGGWLFHPKIPIRYCIEPRFRGNE